MNWVGSIGPPGLEMLTRWKRLVRARDGLASLVRLRVAPPVDFDLGPLHGKEHDDAGNGDGRGP